MWMIQTYHSHKHAHPRVRTTQACGFASSRLPAASAALSHCYEMRIGREVARALALFVCVPCVCVCVGTRAACERCCRPTRKCRTTTACPSGTHTDRPTCHPSHSCVYAPPHTHTWSTLGMCVSAALVRLSRFRTPRIELRHRTVVQ